MEEIQALSANFVIQLSKERVIWKDITMPVSRLMGPPSMFALGVTEICAIANC